MSYAVLIGTARPIWIDDAPTPEGHVRYDGPMPGKDKTDATELVWGDDIQNLRVRTQAELDALPAQKITADHTEIVALLNDYGDRPVRLMRALMLLMLDEINTLRGIAVGAGTIVFDPANMANGTGVTSGNITVTGAAFGDYVDVAAAYSLQGIVATAYVSAANTVVIRLHNSTGAAVNLASGTWAVLVRRQGGMQARTNAQAKTAMTNKINAGDADS